jgi:hypothetical protein
MTPSGRSARSRTRLPLSCVPSTKSGPLTTDDKTKLAVLFAFQHLRGPRWKTEYESRTQGFLDKYDRENLAATLSPAELEQQNAELMSDTRRHVMMLTTGATTTEIFASMHWTLIEFRSSLLAISDHPVVLWSGAASRSPRATKITQIGILECIEIRLLMSSATAEGTGTQNTSPEQYSLALSCCEGRGEGLGRPPLKGKRGPPCRRDGPRFSQ